VPRGPRLDFKTFCRPEAAAMLTARAASAATISALGVSSWIRDIVALLFVFVGRWLVVGVVFNFN